VVRVQSVAPGSLGAALGLVPGTELQAVNGRALEDFLDWEFLTADEQFVLSATLPGGDAVEYDVERPEGLPMGVTLEAPRIRRCANHCDFCFVDGNPAGMRAPLYIRDDDYRLSFRYGNFATLTNLKPWDVARIVEYRLSPLYVSVHATDPTVRRWLLRNPEAPEIVPQLRALAGQGIAFHTQVVLVPGANDGAELVRTLSDLLDLGEPIRSVSVVPVALTEYSKRDLVRELTRAECRVALATVDRFATRVLAERGDAPSGMHDHWQPPLVGEREDPVGLRVGQPELLGARVQLDPARARGEASLGLAHRVVPRVEPAIGHETPLGGGRLGEYAVVRRPVAVGLVHREDNRPARACARESLEQLVDRLAHPVGVV